MKQECPTYLKLTGKSKALAATLSDNEPNADSEDNDQEGTFMAFTTTIESPKESEELVVEEEELTESKFEKMDKKMTYLMPTQSFTRILRSMKSFIG